MKEKIDFNTKQNTLPSVSAYFSASIRGKKGSNATKKDIAENIAAGKKMANKIQKFFGSILSMYVPHNQDELIQILWYEKKITVWDILDGDCKILAARDIMLVWIPGGYRSNGVTREIHAATAVNMPIIEFEEFNSDVAKQIFSEIYDVVKSKEDPLSPSVK